MTLLARALIETESGDPAAFRGGQRGELLHRITGIVSRRHLGFVTGWQMSETAAGDVTVPSDEEMLAELP